MLVIFHDSKGLKYMSLTLVQHLFFIDSKQFMNFSSNCMSKNFSLELAPECFEEKLELGKREAFYACKYMDYFEKFEEGLLKKNKFYSSSSYNHINDKDYNHAVKILTAFDVKNMK